MVVISSVKMKAALARLEARLNHLIAKPLIVVGVNNAYHTFVPRFGIGTVTTQGGIVDPTTLMDEAEHLAMGRENEPQDGPMTTGSLFADSSFQ
jgi:hypothetical protein